MTVRPITYANGTTKFLADLGRDSTGRRVIKTFDTHAEAVERVRITAQEMQRYGDAALSMDAPLRARYAKAEEQLRTADASIEEAVRYYLSHHGHVTEPLGVLKLSDQCADDKATLKRRPRYVKTLRNSGKFLAELLPAGIKAHQVTRDALRKAMKKRTKMVGRKRTDRPISGKTRNNWLIDIGTIWNWGIAHGHCAIDPTKGIELSSADEGEIGHLTAHESAKLLKHVELNAPELLGWHVLALYAGIRPEEIQRMTWADVREGEGTAFVRGVSAKTRARRLVELEPAALAWLKRCPRREDGKIVPGKIDNELAELRECVRPRGQWPHDGCRHTYASMHYAMFRDEERLQANMGHRDKDELFKAYRAVVSKAEAELFWTEFPDAKEREAARKARAEENAPKPSKEAPRPIGWGGAGS